ncbi:MAG: hydroxyethylthiazole kinase [Saccharofermentans sp.]|nr:hydroxyethylthiazole kinase [Saccharofermentans sp.]
MEEKTRNRLIHIITNPISMDRCADAVLTLGAKPMMAEHPLEVQQITSTASALLLNLGNITDIRMTSMKISIKEANRIGIPVVIDAVGVACSSLRRQFIDELLKEGRALVIKGNYSEIMALYDSSYSSSGVDAQEGLAEDLVKEAALKLASDTNAFIVATGSRDLISDGKKVEEVTGGCSQMALVTGTGCMLGAVIATYMAEDCSYESLVKACSFFKECGARAKTDKGNGTYMVNLLDNLGGQHEA